MTNSTRLKRAFARLASFKDGLQAKIRSHQQSYRRIMVALDSVIRTLTFLSKMIGICCASTVVSFFSVVWLWIAVKQRKSSSLPNLIHSNSAPTLLARFFALIFVVNVLYLMWIMIKVTRSRVKVRTGKIRTDRVDVGNYLPILVAALEILIFRFLWNSYQIHPRVRPNLVVNPLVDLEDLGSILLVVGWLRWIKIKIMRWVPRAAGISLAPVVGVLNIKTLLLADGTPIRRWPALEWPSKGIGRSTIVAIAEEPDGDVIYVTDRGDCFHPIGWRRYNSLARISPGAR